MAQQPPYQPNVVNQTVDYGGAIWKGEPGGNWRYERPSGGGDSGGSFSSAPVTPSFDPVAQAQKLLEFQRTANKPAISSLQAQIPETSAKFQTERTRLEGEKEPLKQRYQNLLDEIKRRESVDVSAQERIKSREFGRRGIPLSSGLFDVERQEATSPLRQFYTGQAKDIGLGQESSMKSINDLIASLTGQETEANRLVKNAIAQLQSGEPSSAIQGALSLISTQQQAAQSQAQNELARQQLEVTKRGQDLAYAPKTPSLADRYATIGEGSTLFDLLTGKPTYTASKTYKPTGSGSGNEADVLKQIFGPSRYSFMS